MKKYGIISGVIGVLLVLGFIFLNFQKEVNARAKRERAQMNFNNQLEKNWEIALKDMGLIELRAQDPKQLRTFANFQYKRVEDIGFKKIDQSYKNEADDFISLKDKTASFYKKLAMAIDKENKDRIIFQAKDLDDSLMSFYKKHPDYRRPPVNLESVMESNMNKLVTNPVKQSITTTPKVIVVASYPNWVSTSNQRESWDSMRIIARDYFTERHRLSLEISWTQARNNPEYLLNDSVQQKLDYAISIRQNLLTRLNNVEASEGMSALGNKIGTMLQNSINSLNYAKSGDYARFKAYNNSNDAIQTEVRRTFNIR